MLPFNLTLFDLLFSWALVTPYFIVAKILSQDWKLRWRESIYIALISLSLAIFLYLTYSTVNVLLYISNVVAMLCFFFYFYKIVKKSLLESIILSAFTFIIALFIEFVMPYPVAYFFPAFQITRAPLPLVIYGLLVNIVSTVTALLLAKVLRKFLASIADIARLQSALALLTTFLFLFFQIIVVIQESLGHTATLFSWVTTFFLSYAVAVSICFLFYARALKANQKVQEKEIEYRTLLYYMGEYEHQQTAIRKFKHDQQNLFSTLDIYIQDKDWDGLLQFYPKVRAASEVITKSEFALEDLSKIKVREIKNILTAKLAMAQNLGVNSKFETGETIDYIPADPVALVRMLGIILDNAIEELQSLDTGELLVACFKSEDSVNFVVQNTCRPDMPPLRQLRQSRFSTKGNDRGLGLNNLYELANSLPNVALLTDIADGQFRQTLIIGDDVSC